jgi:hypothetical protein
MRKRIAIDIRGTFPAANRPELFSSNWDPAPPLIRAHAVYEGHLAGGRELWPVHAPAVAFAEGAEA